MQKFFLAVFQSKVTVYCSLYSPRRDLVPRGEIQEAHLLVNLDHGLLDEDLNALALRANENVVTTTS